MAAQKSTADMYTVMKFDPNVFTQELNYPPEFDQLLETEGEFKRKADHLTKYITSLNQRLLRITVNQIENDLDNIWNELVRDLNIAFETLHLDRETLREELEMYKSLDVSLKNIEKSLIDDNNNNNDNDIDGLSKRETTKLSLLTKTQNIGQMFKTLSSSITRPNISPARNGRANSVLVSTTKTTSQFNTGSFAPQSKLGSNIDESDDEDVISTSQQQPTPSDTEDGIDVSNDGEDDDGDINELDSPSPATSPTSANTNDISERRVAFLDKGKRYKQILAFKIYTQLQLPKIAIPQDITNYFLTQAFKKSQVLARSRSEHLKKMKKERNYANTIFRYLSMQRKLENLYHIEQRQAGYNPNDVNNDSDIDEEEGFVPIGQSSRGRKMTVTNDNNGNYCYFYINNDYYHKMAQFVTRRAKFNILDLFGISFIPPCIFGHVESTAPSDTVYAFLLSLENNPNLTLEQWAEQYQHTIVPVELDLISEDERIFTMLNTTTQNVVGTGPGSPNAAAAAANAVATAIVATRKRTITHVANNIDNNNNTTDIPIARSRTNTIIAQAQKQQQQRQQQQQRASIETTTSDDKRIQLTSGDYLLSSKDHTNSPTPRLTKSPSSAASASATSYCPSDYTIPPSASEDSPAHFGETESVCGQLVNFRMQKYLARYLALRHRCTDTLILYDTTHPETLKYLDLPETAEDVVFVGFFEKPEDFYLDQITLHVNGLTIYDTQMLNKTRKYYFVITLMLGASYPQKTSIFRNVPSGSNAPAIATTTTTPVDNEPSMKVAISQTLYYNDLSLIRKKLSTENTFGTNVSLYITFELYQHHRLGTLLHKDKDGPVAIGEYMYDLFSDSALGFDDVVQPVVDLRHTMTNQLVGELYCDFLFNSRWFHRHLRYMRHLNKIAGNKNLSSNHNNNNDGDDEEDNNNTTIKNNHTAEDEKDYQDFVDSMGNVSLRQIRNSIAQSNTAGIAMTMKKTDNNAIPPPPPALDEEDENESEYSSNNNQQDNNNTKITATNINETPSQQPTTTATTKQRLNTTPANVTNDIVIHNVQEIHGDDDFFNLSKPRGRTESVVYHQPQSRARNTIIQQPLPDIKPIIEEEDEQKATAATTTTTKETQKEVQDDANTRGVSIATPSIVVDGMQLELPPPPDEEEEKEEKKKPLEPIIAEEPKTTISEEPKTTISEPKTPQKDTYAPRRSVAFQKAQQQQQQGNNTAPATPSSASSQLGFRSPQPSRSLTNHKPSTPSSATAPINNNNNTNVFQRSSLIPSNTRARKSTFDELPPEGGVDMKKEEEKRKIINDPNTPLELLIHLSGIKLSVAILSQQQLPTFVSETFLRYEIEELHKMKQGQANYKRGVNSLNVDKKIEELELRLNALTTSVENGDIEIKEYIQMLQKQSIIDKALAVRVMQFAHFLKHYNNMEKAQGYFAYGIWIHQRYELTKKEYQEIMATLSEANVTIDPTPAIPT